MLKKIALNNADQLSKNPYPGRGIVIGATGDGKKAVIIYWIMGRSENSRNRIFVEQEGTVGTRAFDESKVTDPSLIIYNPVRHVEKRHIVSNGDQTDTVYHALASGKTFEQALMTRTYEPDAPNFTPRITGLIDLPAPNAYTLSILKKQDGGSDGCFRAFYNYEKWLPGFGHCIHTYQEDGNPLPSFQHEPYLMPIPDEAGLLEYYWSLLNADNRVSLLIKTIDLQTGGYVIKIKNRHA